MKVLCSAFALLLALSPWTKAAVFLSTDLPGAMVRPGEEFEIILRLNITNAEQVESISYYWQAEAAGSELFQLTERNTSGSPITWLYHDDAAILESPANLLDPVNTLNLGGLTDEEPLSTGVWLVARYRVQVDPTVLAGLFTLTTFSPAGTGWTTPPPGAQNFTFSEQAVFTVTVIPEPAVLPLLFVGFTVGVILRKRAIHR